MIFSETALRFPAQMLQAGQENRHRRSGRRARSNGAALSITNEQANAM
jgi:hypothetical protein